MNEKFAVEIQLFRDGQPLGEKIKCAHIYTSPDSYSREQVEHLQKILAAVYQERDEAQAKVARLQQSLQNERVATNTFHAKLTVAETERNTARYERDSFKTQYTELSSLWSRAADDLVVTRKKLADEQSNRRTGEALLRRVFFHYDLSPHQYLKKEVISWLDKNDPTNSK
jgi:chromosome segregation ATPase